jgi:rhodanese-related sulfurtransferase
MRLLILAVAAFALILTYAPPVPAAAYDALNMVSAEELKARIDGGASVVLLDVRSRGAYDASDVKIKGAVRIPTDELPDRLFELPFGREIATYCT